MDNKDICKRSPELEFVEKVIKDLQNQDILPPGDSNPEESGIHINYMALFKQKLEEQGQIVKPGDRLQYVVTKDKT